MFGFANTWLFAGLLAIGLPVAIHYLTRPRPKPIDFPMVGFLLEAASGKQAMNRLRTFIVLALRCLAVAMLVLLFSGPFVRNRAVSATDHNLKRVVIIVDASFSMQAAQGGVTLFDKARAQAIELLKNLKNNAAAGVIIMESEPRLLLPDLTTNLPALVTRLSGTRPTYEAARTTDALARAKALLNGPGSVFVFSDFQRANWEDAVFEASQDVMVFLRPVLEQPLDNLAVTGIQVVPSAPVAGQEARISCSVLNCSAKAVSRPLFLEFMGESHSALVEAGPFETVHVEFGINPRIPGVFAGTITLDATDSLHEDNTRYFRLDVKTENFVLIMGDDNVSDYSGSTFFTAAAISPWAPGERGVRTVVRHSQDTGTQVMERASSFVLCPPAVLSDIMAKTLSGKIVNGASLILFLDGKTAPALIKQLETASGGVISPPFELSGQMSARNKDGEPLVPPDYPRPPLTLFSGHDTGDLSTIRAARYYMTTIKDDRKSEVLITYPDGTAALAVSPCGQGRVFFLNIPPCSDGGNLVASPLFAPLLHECLAMEKNVGSGDARPGVAWEIIVKQNFAPASLKVLGPEKREIGFEAVSLGSNMRLAMEPALMPGVYTALQGTQTAAMGVINIDPEESDFRLADPTDLANKNRDASGSITVQGKSIMVNSDKKDLWPLAAIILCIFLMLEMLVLGFWPKPESR